MKRTFALLVFLLVLFPATQSFAQYGGPSLPVATIGPSTFYSVTYGMGMSSWDLIYYPSYAGMIEDDFIYGVMPDEGAQTGSSDGTVDSTIDPDAALPDLSAGAALRIGPLRVFGLANVHQDASQVVGENENFSEGSVPYDSDSDGTDDAYQLTTVDTNTYERNSLEQSTYLLSPGAALRLGPLSAAGRLIVQTDNIFSARLERTRMTTITDATFASDNVATSTDDSVMLDAKGGVVTGFVAGGAIQLGPIGVYADLTSTVGLWGSYDRTDVTNNHLINIAGLIDGATADYVDQVVTNTFTGGFIDYIALPSTTTSDPIMTPQSLFQYSPYDTTYGEPTLRMPQTVIHQELRGQGQLGGLIFPASLSVTTSSLRNDPFSMVLQTDTYVADDQLGSTSTTTLTQTVTSDRNAITTASAGALRRIRLANPLTVQIGLIYDIARQVYHIRIDQDQEVQSQVDGNADGDYADSGTDTDQSTVSSNYLFERDYAATTSTFTVPISFIAQAVDREKVKVEIFGTGEFSHTLVATRDTGYLESNGGYTSVEVIDNFTDTVTTPDTTPLYPTEFVGQYSRNRNSSPQAAFEFGVRVAFEDWLILTSQVLTGELSLNRLGTGDSDPGSILGGNLAGELELVIRR